MIKVCLFLGDVCCNPLSLGGLQKFIEEAVPGVYVKSLMIGNSIKEVSCWNEVGSYFEFYS